MTLVHIDVVSFVFLLCCSFADTTAAFVMLVPKARRYTTTSRQMRLGRQQLKTNDLTTLCVKNSRANDDRENVPIDKTYENYKKDAIIDDEGAMVSFFTSREEWLPLFRSVAGNDLPKDTSSLINSLVSTPSLFTPLIDDDVHETSFPWKRYDAIPSNEEDRSVVARFLDSMQESLLAIPVIDDPNARIVDMTSGDGNSNEFEEDDENDMQFIEEGRRLLALNRFHVLSNSIFENKENKNANGLNGNDSDFSTIESADELFRHCWSEIYALSQEGKENSGSLILLPYEYKLPNVRRFVEMNIVQPLQWLGIQNDYEVSSFQRDSPAIRVIYKLNDMSTTSSYTEEDGFAG